MNTPKSAEETLRYLLARIELVDEYTEKSGRAMQSDVMTRRAFADAVEFMTGERP